MSSVIPKADVQKPEVIRKLLSYNKYYHGSSRVYNVGDSIASGSYVTPHLTYAQSLFKVVYEVEKPSKISHTLPIGNSKVKSGYHIITEQPLKVLGVVGEESIHSNLDKVYESVSDVNLVPPQSAQNNAKKALEWKDKYGDEVKGGTQVGWTRARQLADGGSLSPDVVKRMASFARHEQNSKVSDEYKDTPWKDRGYVAWLIWGGTSGIEWAKRKSEELDNNKEKYNGEMKMSKLNVLYESVCEENVNEIEKDLKKLGRQKTRPTTIQDIADKYGVRYKTVLDIADKIYPKESILDKLHESVCKEVKYKLTTEEDRFWTKSFEDYLNNGYSDSKADQLAYKDLVKKFPHIKQYKQIESLSLKETKQTKVANKVMEVSGDIMRRNKLSSGRDMIKHEKELIDTLKLMGITRLTKEDALALEDNNYHTELDILYKKGMVPKWWKESLSCLDKPHESVCKEFSVGDSVLADLSTKSEPNNWVKTKILKLNGNIATIDTGKYLSGAKTAEIDVKHLKKESLSEDHVAKGLFPMEEFQKGLDVEMGEHTNVNPLEAAQLVLDHLKENEYYYTKGE